jgi:iron complex transport system substrate-binding protein
MTRLARRSVLIGAGATLWGTARLARAADAATRLPTRVIVVGGALAEVVYALGQSQRLVATDTTCTYPEAAARLPKIGYQRTLSAEGLLALRPDRVLASAEAGPPGVLQQIGAAGVTVTRFTESHDVDAVRAKIDGVAQALGAVDAGARLRRDFDARWATAQAAVSAAPLAGKRVLFLLNPAGNQPMVAGRHTAADAMIAYAGARNVTQDVDGYKALSPEALVGAAPDVVLTTSDSLQAAGGPATLLAGPGFAATPAGRGGRVVALDTLLMLGFGPRLPEAVTQLHGRLRAA